MYKKEIITILLSLITTICNAQKIRIALDIDDCKSCLDFSKFTDSIQNKFDIILSEKYMNQIPLIEKKYYLTNTKINWILNNRLFEKYSYDNQSPIKSSINICNSDDSTICSKYSINHHENVSQYYKQLQQNHYSIMLDPHIDDGSSIQYIDAKYFYFMDILSERVKLVDRMTFKQVAHLKLNDSIGISGFKKVFGNKEGEKRYLESVQFILKNRISEGVKIFNIKSEGEQVYLFVKYLFPQKKNNSTDTVMSDLDLMLTYDKHQLQDIKYIERRINGVGDYAIPNNDGKYYISSDLMFNQGLLLLDLWDSDIHHKVLFDRQGDRYKYKEIYKGVLPKPYSNVFSHNYRVVNQGIISDKNYFTFSFSDTIYNALNPDEKLVLDLFEFDLDSKTLPFFTVWEFKISDKFIYMIYMDKRSNEYKYVKKNRESGNVLVHKAIQNYKKTSFYRTPTIDPLNYDYVFWWENLNILHRQRM